MTASPQTPTNPDVLHQLLSLIVRTAYERATQSIEGVLSDASEPDCVHLQERLVSLQLAMVNHLFSLIEGSSGPTDWPKFKLVNAETNEALSDELTWDLGSVKI